MTKLLITGATGKVGSEIIKLLSSSLNDFEVFAASRNPDRFNNLPENIKYIRFDLDHNDTIDKAFAYTDILFLMRPPQISNIEAYFSPLVDIAKLRKIKHIVFLSVQGADRMKFIPHRKIELLIEKSGIPYTFLRPSYFMQNMTDSLLKEINTKGIISLPAANAKFNLISTCDIAKAVQFVIANIDKYQNKTFDITGSNNYNFHEIADNISKTTGKKVIYKKTGLFGFFNKYIHEDILLKEIFIKFMIHYIAVKMPEPVISSDYFDLTGSAPTTFNDFLISNKHLFV